MSRIIMHCDCNAFYASVAETVNPSLKNVPMAVCGDPNSRHGIILAKNELAKKFGIQTAETIWQAKKKCPDLVLAPTYWELYNKYYHEINNIYENYTDIVERFGIDESFLDLTNSIHLFKKSPLDLANIIKERVYTETGITISIGVSYNKIFAKMGSDYKKPYAVTSINQDNFKTLLWCLPVESMYMVGKSTKQKLYSLYIKTIGELAKTSPDLLETHLGKLGLLLHVYANGIDNTEVKPYYKAEQTQSIGNGRTFRRDLVSMQDTIMAAKTLSDTVAKRLRQHSLKCLCIQITIKDPGFKSITRQTVINTPTYLSKDISAAALDLIEKSWKKGNPIRMLTITAQKLVDANETYHQTSLFSDNTNDEMQIKQSKLECTIDKLKDKFGKNSITYGTLIDEEHSIY